jgi:phage terminase Nu1 subunit (DNA packaging protein)
VLVVVDQLVDALNVTPRRVHQLAAAGMPQAGRGRYDTDACLRWFVRFLQSAVERRESLTGKSSTDAVRKARARLLNVRVEDVEHELAEKKGELVPVSLMRQPMGVMILQSRQQLLMLPARIAPSLEGESRNVIKAKLAHAIHGALAALAEHGAGNLSGNGNGHEHAAADPAAPDAPSMPTACGPDATSTTHA